MRVLFYGSFSTSDGNLTPENLRIAKDLAHALVLKGHKVLTREGSSAQATDFEVVDNPVLAGALAAVSSSGRADLVESICDPTHLDKNIQNPSRRKMVRAPTAERFAFYRTLLNACDVVCVLGGSSGVQRLSMIGRFIEKPLVPIGATGGVARQIWSELASVPQTADVEIADLLSSLGHLNSGGEAELIENAVKLMNKLYEASQRSHNANVAQLATLGLPDKVSGHWLWRNVPYTFWIGAVVALSTAFMAGTLMTAKVTWVQQLLDVVCKKGP